MHWIRHALLLLLLCFASLAVQAPLAAPVTLSTDPCGVGVTGNVDATGIVDISDLSLLVTYLVVPGTTLPCPDEANVNASGIIDVSDLSLLTAYLVIPGTTLPACPNAAVLMPAAERSAALTAALQQVNNLKDLPDDQFLPQMLAYFQGNAAFEASGINPATNNVWARFTDGIGFVVGRSLEFSPDTLDGEPLPSPASPNPVDEETPDSRPDADYRKQYMSTPAAAGTGDDLPNSVSARVVLSVGEGFPSVGVTTRRLISWLTSNGYYITSTSGKISDLKAVGGDGILYFLGHGEAEELRDATTAYCISTTNDALTPAQNAAYENEMAAGRLAIMCGPFDYDANKNEIWGIRFGITSKFVTHYWKNFAPNAMVFVNACRSDSALDFKAAVQAKGGPAYLGWTRVVNSKDACDVAEFMIDRMLGANKHYRKETPAQRPFDCASIYDDLKARGLHIRPNNDASAGYKTVFRYTPGSSNFGILAPSIKFMSVNEPEKKLDIVGIFGADPGPDGRVTVDGTPLTVISWNPNLIECNINPKGPGSCGTTIVEKRGDYDGLTPLTYRKSNEVNLTEWRGIMAYTREEQGTLKIAVNVNVHIRADIHAFREKPHETPIESIVLFDQIEDAAGDYKASGTYGYCENEMCLDFVWSGADSMYLLADSASGLEGFFYHGSVDSKLKKLNLFLGEGLQTGLTQTTTYTPPGQTVSAPLMWALNMDYLLYDLFVPDLTFVMPLDDNFGILVGDRLYMNPVTYTSSPDQLPATTKMHWGSIPATAPPDKDAAQ